jgi:uncharacterized protein HemX
MTTLIAIIIAAAVGAGVAYYVQQQNTLVEVGIGDRSLSIQKN